MATTGSARAGCEYPRTLAEFNGWFRCDDDCRAFLERLRWPEGFRCGCGGERAWRVRRDRLRCCACGRETSATAGTLFEGARLPLTTWFQAAWFVTNQKLGTSALGLQRALGLSRYETVWTILHKYRRAMVRPEREPLAGEIEVDESYVGGGSRGSTGRGSLAKTIVAIAVEARPQGACGRARLARIPDCSGPVLSEFVLANCAPEAVIYTDGWAGYLPLGETDVTHIVTVTTSSIDPAHVLMPRVHRVSALLKRWLLGTHQGGISERHLDFYLDEFVFRFNRRGSGSRGLLFYRLLQQAVQTQPIPGSTIVRGRP
jgi:transposase-like protein